MSAIMAASSAAEQIPINSNGNGLILYLYPGSYYSKKVLLALHEKRLKYKPQLVNLFAGEHLKPCFLKLNPKGQVPVLQDGIKVIPDSDSIIDYLEDNFYNGNFPKLQPAKGSEASQKVKMYVDLLGKVDVAALSYGTIYNPQLAFEPTMSESESKARLSFQHIEHIVEDFQRLHPENRELLEQKKERYRMMNAFYQDSQAIIKEITSTENILEQIEGELASHKDDQERWWLCCDMFTTADVFLATLLNHFDGIGLTHSLLNPTKRPCLRKYKERLRQRPTFEAFELEVKQLQRLLEPSSYRRSLTFFMGTVTFAGLVAVMAMLYNRAKKV